MIVQLPAPPMTAQNETICITALFIFFGDINAGQEDFTTEVRPSYTQEGELSQQG